MNNILILAVVLNAVFVNSSTSTFGALFKYLERDEPRTSHHLQRKPVISSPMTRQYFNDEPVNSALQPLRPDYYDLANDPDPIIDNLPPGHDNFLFLANLNEAQLHELIAEGMKYQEIAQKKHKEYAGIVEVGEGDSEESSESSDAYFDTEETGDLHFLIDEEYEGEHDIEHTAESEDVITTTTPKTTAENTTTSKKPETRTKKTTTTTETPETTAESQTISENLTTKEPSTNSSTTTKPISTPTTSTTANATSTTTTQSPLTMSNTTFITEKPAISLPPPTTTLIPVINRIHPVNSSDEINSLTPSEIDEEIDEQGETDPETDVEYQTLTEPATTKRPSSLKPIQSKPSRKPNKKPSKRPNRRPGKRPGRRPSRPYRRPIRVHINKKGYKRKGNPRPLNIKINPSKLQKRPVRVNKLVTMCPYECQCGVTTTRRIVGGTNAEKNEFPWVALLLYNGQLTCGGAVLNSDYVITAAHCMHHQKKTHFTVKLMQHDRIHDDKTKLITRMISNIYIHPNYNSKTTDKDIALIKLNQPVDFSKSPIRPICLPSLGKNFSGSMGVIAGWGTTSENGHESTVLKKAKVPIISNNQCKSTGIKGITSNMLCAGRIIKGGVDSCQGDSGGPLMVPDNKRYVLGGIVSFGQGCARPNNPGVYTRTTKFLDWIRKTATSGCYCK